MANDNPQKDPNMDFLLEFREFRGTVMTKLDRAIDDIKDLKDNIVGRVENLEKDHVSRIEFEALQNWRYYLAGAIAILIAIITLFVIPEYNSSTETSKNIDSRLQAVEIKLDLK